MTMVILGGAQIITKTRSELRMKMDLVKTARPGLNTLSNKQ